MSEDNPMSRFLVAGQPLSLAEAEELVTRLQHDAVVSEAELAAHGRGFLTIAHGDLETDDDVKRARDLSAWALGHRAYGRVSLRTTNDTTTWLISAPQDGPSDVEEFVTGLETVAHQLNPGWWKIRRTAR